MQLWNGLKMTAVGFSWETVTCLKLDGREKSKPVDQNGWCEPETENIFGKINSRKKVFETFVIKLAGLM